MEAKDLRIGNFVTLSEKTRSEMWDNQVSAENEYFKVDTIYSDGDIVLELDLENIDFPSKDLEPIGISEEWLLKFGFEILHHGKFRKVYDLLKDSRFGYSDNYGLANIDSAVTFGSKEFTHIKYIHQLQNLYHALTGEELTINKALN